MTDVLFIKNAYQQKEVQNVLSNNFKYNYAYFLTNVKISYNLIGHRVFLKLLHSTKINEMKKTNKFQY